MRQLFCWALLLLCGVWGWPENVSANDCVPLRARNAEGNYIVPGVWGGIVYKRLGAQTLALDAYMQKKGGTRPAVMVLHGGGFTTGSRSAFIGQYLELLTKAGYNWFAIDYRLNNSQAALDDVRAALAFIRCHARAFKIDEARLAVLGEDTGAQLALQAASENNSGIKAVLSVGGMFDAATTASNNAATLFVHGTADREMPIAQVKQVCEKNSRCEFLLVEGGIHRAENWRPEQWGYKPKMIEWLNRQMNFTQGAHEPYRTNLQKNIVFSTAHGLQMDAYIPRRGHNFPAVIIAHGGGWEAGDKVTYVTPIFAPLAEAGFAWFSIDYRLTPQFNHQAQLDDVRAALNFVRANAKRFRIDPHRIALLGESASGQMAAQLAADPALKLAAVVSFYGVYDFAAMSQEITPRSIPARLFGITQWDEQARATLRQYSPLHNIHASMPPMLLLCGTKDGLFAQHQNYSQHLRAAGVKVDTIEIDGAPHGMENWEGHPEWIRYKIQLVNWLKTQLKK